MSGEAGDWLSAGLKISSELTGKLKGLRELERQIDQFELKKALLETSEQVLEMRTALLRAREELQDRDKMITELTAALDGRESIKRINGLLRELGPDGNPTEIRICDRCKAVDDKLVPMLRQSEGRYICPNCKSPAREDNAPPRPSSRVIRG